MTVRTIEHIELLERLFLRALSKADVAVLDELWAEDFSLTGPDGTHFDKADCLACVAEGRLTFDAFDLEFIDGAIHGNDAVVRCQERVRGRLESEAFDAVVRHVSIYSKARNRWRQVSTIVPSLECSGDGLARSPKTTAHTRRGASSRRSAEPSAFAPATHEGG